MMRIDYYNILKVNHNASIDDLQKSYKSLAMIRHPDKNPTSRRAEAKTKFKQISEAFDVLSDPQKRQVYGLYGEEALKSRQFPPPSRIGRWSFRRDPGVGHCRHYECNRTSFRKVEDIYAGIFGAEGGVGEGGEGRRCGHGDRFYTTSSSRFGGGVGEGRKGQCPDWAMLMCAICFREPPPIPEEAFEEYLIDTSINLLTSFTSS